MTDDLSRLDQALRWLAARGHISGSYARGEEGGDSDIDVRLPNRQLQTLKRRLDAQGVHWMSTITGHVVFRPDQPFDAPFIEVYDGFPRYGPRGSTVWVHGVEFRR